MILILTFRRFSSRAEKLAETDDQEITKTDDDDAQTAAYLIGRQESNVIITGPREYQIELFERAKQENTIAVLPTGKNSQEVKLDAFTANGSRFWEDTDSGAFAEAYLGPRARGSCSGKTA